MAKDGSSNFEIPAEMRAFAEKSVAQAKLAFDSFISAAQQAVNTAETHAATTRVGAKEAGDLAMQFAERNIASSFDFAQRLLQAKDPQEVAKLHAEYVKSQVATLTEQAKELSKQAAKIAGQGTPH
ncbi:MAG TPA: phasin family protein [Pseudolabrys sp.]|jgi:phasin|nr:phasin family protein [Pseudolabrys sp.]